MKNGLYHRDLFLPAQAVNAVKGRTFELRLTNHARNACYSDRYGTIVPPKTVSVSSENIIELEVLNGNVTKAVVRNPYDDKKDIIIVIIPLLTEAVCKTFWFNLKSDTHKTLDRSRYISA